MKNLNQRIHTIYLFGIPWLFCFPILILNVIAPTIYLEDLDSGSTSPTGDYRWLDVANQAYCSDYRNSYNYTQATVELDYNGIGETLNGILNAFNLKPNFAYQLKLVGTPGKESNEKIGLVGRWWQEEWNGTAWINGQNLNNKGDGSSPNPNDNTYFTRKNITDPTSPTGYKYKYTGYLVFDYFITDENGNATVNFETNSSYHVLWKTTQRVHTVDDGRITSTTFDVNASSLAYAVDYPVQTVDIFGEWERLPVGGMFLQPGNYSAETILTEESFHGDGGSYSGNWARAIGKNINFIIPDMFDILSLQYRWNLFSLSFNESVDKTAIIVRYNGIDYSWNDAVSAGYILDTIYGWNGTVYTIETSLTHGKGYWFYAYNDCQLLIYSNAVGTGHIADLQTKWNMVGLPYESPINTVDLQFEYLSSTHTWQQAIDDGYILGFVYGWDRTNQLYILATQLQPGYGYWMYAYQTCTMKQ
jgi:hypothetical protein